MDERLKTVISRKGALHVLNHLDENLTSAYPAPGKTAFSSDEDLGIVQRAVLYHQIRRNAALRTGTKDMMNDLRYEELASAIVEGRDPIVNFIRDKKPPEQAELLEDLVQSDQRKPWFEDMLLRAEEKKAEASAVAPAGNTDDPRQRVSARMRSEESRLQSEMLRRFAERRKQTPGEFFSDMENVQAAKRMLAIELHRRQLEFEERELSHAYRYETPERRKELLEKRNLFTFEKLAENDYEAHLKRLEQSTEIATMLRHMLYAPDLQAMSAMVIEPPLMPHLHTRDTLCLMENKLVPEVVRRLLDGPDAPKKDSKEEKMLLELTAMQEELEYPPGLIACMGRLEEYRDVLKRFEKKGLLATEDGKELKEVLEGQIERLEERTLAPDREKVEFNFRANTLIDYIDPNDPEQRPMDALEAREKLIRGVELEQKTFVDDEFVGTVQKISYDKDNECINKGPEKLITRVVDLSDKTGRRPDMQIEELRKIKEVLVRTNAFYVKSSESFQKTFDTLNKLIKTHEQMNKEANVRQVAELRALYAELAANAAQYVSEKSERLKAGDERGQFRMDAIRTLQSITGKEHIKKITSSLFTEQQKLDRQKKLLNPCEDILKKWVNKRIPTDPEGLAAFKKDFDALSERLEKLQKNHKDLSYFKMGIAEDLETFAAKANAIADEAKLDKGRITAMEKIADEGNAAQVKFYAMDPTLDRRIEKRIEDPKKVKEPLVK